MHTEIYDLSYTLTSETPVYPGDNGIEIEVVQTASEPTTTSPRKLNCSRISLGVHNGTHIDAPFHFFSDRKSIEAIPIDRCFGPAVWLDLTTTITPGIIDSQDLIPYIPSFSNKKKVLIYTGWEQHWELPDYFSDHPVLTKSAAEQFVSSAIELVGVDFPSVDLPPFDAHIELLGNDILIVENLKNISKLGAGEFDFYGIPLSIPGRDASPIRAFAIKQCV